MKVNNINTITPMNNYNSPSFNGRILVKGSDWTPELRHAFMKSKGIHTLARGKDDVIGRLKTYWADDYDMNHCSGETLYKLSIELRKPNASLLEKTKSFLGLNSHCINRHKHSERSLSKIIHDLDAQIVTKLINRQNEHKV